MVPVISFVGSSNSGKTTYLEKLIIEMRQRGYRVGIIKHHLHDFAIDMPGKDTWRYSQAGADNVCISSPGKMALIQQVESELTIDHIVAMMRGIDIVFTEGYKHGNKPKIEIFRQAVCDKPVADKEELIAVVADIRLYDDVPTFNLNHPAAELADFIEQWLKYTCN